MLGVLFYNLRVCRTGYNDFLVAKIEAINLVNFLICEVPYRLAFSKWKHCKLANIFVKIVMYVEVRYIVVGDIYELLLYLLFEENNVFDFSDIYKKVGCFFI